MKLLTKVLLLTLVIIILGSLFLAAYSLALDPTDYKPKDTTNIGSTTTLTKTGSTIVAAIQTVGTLVAIITLLVLGIRYLFATAQEKAELKGLAPKYVIGAVLLFGGVNLVAIIYNISSSL
jgi:type IV secretory pathway VirB2 component (pilin)